MVEILSETYGRPGGPGAVEVQYASGLFKGCPIRLELASPGQGGQGGLPDTPTDSEAVPFVHRGGAGGGRENTPILDALVAYAKSREGTEHEPLYLLSAERRDFTWPHDTPTATIVTVQPGGGGGGGMGELLAGQEGEDGLEGAVFMFPTYLLAQNPQQT